MRENRTYGSEGRERHLLYPYQFLRCAESKWWGRVAAKLLRNFAKDDGRPIAFALQ
jgi:hypothetical protein